MIINLGSKFRKTLAQTMTVNSLRHYNTAQLPAKHHIIASLFATLIPKMYRLIYDRFCSFVEI